MKKTALTLWLVAVVSEFIEGCADAFIIVSGAGTGAQATDHAAAAAAVLQPLVVLYGMLIGGLWYCAAYIKKNRPPLETLLVDPAAVVPVSLENPK